MKIKWVFLSFSVGVMSLDVWCASLVTALTQVFLFKQLSLQMSCFILYSALTCKWDLDLSETSWFNKVLWILKKTRFIHTLFQIFGEVNLRYWAFFLCVFYVLWNFMISDFHDTITMVTKMFGNKIVTWAEIKKKRSSVKLIFKAAVSLVVVYLTSCLFCS